MSASNFLIRSCTRFFSSVLLLVSLAGAMSAAEEGLAAPHRFLDDLSTEQKKTLDLDKLSTEQLNTLDGYIRRDIRWARQGEVPAFTGTFTQRRSATEKESAGLDQLSPGARESLDKVVAQALALPPAMAFRPVRAPGNGLAESKARALEVHGSVTLSVGASSGGGSFYGGEVETTVEDPEHRVALSVGYSEYHFNGGSRYRGYGYPGAYGYGYDPAYGYSYGYGRNGVLRDW